MIEVKSISKSFDDIKAVSDISFKANQGEVLGFLGPNGAGKSTTMKIVTGFVEPTMGDVSVCGHSIVSDTLEAQKIIGYVPENAPLYEEMYVVEFLTQIASFREVPQEEIKNRVAEIIKKCALESVQGQIIDTLSKGYKRRVSLAQALIHDPKVLILDEPTDGLDPNQKAEVRSMIKELAREKLVLVSTHILEEVEAICDRCIIIGEGKKLFEGTPSELKAKSDKQRIDDVFRVITTGRPIEGVAI